MTALPVHQMPKVADIEDLVVTELMVAFRWPVRQGRSYDLPKSVAHEIVSTVVAMERMYISDADPNHRLALAQAFDARLEGLKNKVGYHDDVVRANVTATLISNSHASARKWWAYKLNLPHEDYDYA